MSWKKYQIEHKIVSTDGGRTWHPVEPEETRVGSVMGVYQTFEECQNAMYRWVPLDDEICSYLPDENTAVLYTYEDEDGNIFLKGIDKDKSNYCNDVAYLSRIGDTEVKLIGFDVFSEFDDGTTVTFPSADMNVSNDIKWINYEDGTAWGRNVWIGFRSLERVNIDDGVSVSDDFLFTNASFPSLTSVTWNTNDLPTNFLKNANSLTELELNIDGITSIPSGSFNNSWIVEVKKGVKPASEPFQIITIPNSVTEIGADAFNYTHPSAFTVSNLSMKSKLSGSTILNLNYGTGVTFDDFGTTGSIPYHQCCTISSRLFIDSDIPAGLFYSAYTPTYGSSIVIGDNVTSIGDYAFASINNNKLHGSITIGSGVRTIGAHAFSDNVNVSTLVIPDGVTSIGDYAFSGCTGLSSITIPNSVTQIGAGAFMGCTGVSSITIPNSVTQIGAGAFMGCTGLVNVVWTSSVNSIGTDVFNGCTSLSSVTNIGNVTEIGVRAFMGCTGFSDFNLPSNLFWIRDRAFYNVPLNRVIIPRYVSSIGVEAFNNVNTFYSLPANPPTLSDSIGIYGVVVVYVPCSSSSAYNAAQYWKNETIRTMCYNVVIERVGGTTDTVTVETIELRSSDITGKSTVVSVNIDHNIRMIGNETFMNCTALTNIVDDMAENLALESIGKRAFSSCRSLTSITIPFNVTSIGDYAFRYARNLTRITFSNPTPPSIGVDVFYDTNNCPIYVRSTAVNDYKAAWPQYADRITAIIN